jgi:hypothetical protein
MGFNSFTLVALATQLSEQMGQKIDVIDLFTYTTIESLVAYLNGEFNGK